MKTTLQTKILIVLLITFSMIGGMTFIIHQKVLTPNFLELERNQINDNLQRVMQAFTNEQEQLSMLVNDWSAWDDTYNYMGTQNGGYEESNLTESAYAINLVNLILYLDTSGKKVWGKAFDTDFSKTITIVPFDQEVFPPDFPLLQYPFNQTHLEEQQLSGILMTSTGPMLCAARPIIDSNNNGPSRGTLIMGRLLSPVLLEKISRLTNTDYTLKALSGGLADGSSEAVNSLQPGEIHYEGQDDIITASTVMVDLQGEPAIEITLQEERTILKQGLRTLRLSLTLSFVSIAAALAILMLMLQRSVISPINTLTHKLFVRKEVNEPWSDIELKPHVTQEIILLADEFNQLIENLDKKKDQFAKTNLILMREAKKLKEAQYNLRNLDKLKSEFISTAAHELRTPLASIMGFTELLSGKEDLPAFDEQQKHDFLDEIYGNCERLTKIVDDILDVSRIEAGMSIPLDKDPVSTELLLNKSVNRFKIRVKHKISLMINPNSPEKLVIDAHRINQVLENLLSNAIKYSPGDSEISVIAEREGRHCKISVIDQGIGMTKTQLAHVFDKFYRADASDTAIRGLGLGMSIVKQIVKDHGGSIWVESSKGKGTSVYFTLPTE